MGLCWFMLPKYGNSLWTPVPSRETNDWNIHLQLMGLQTNLDLPGRHLARRWWFFQRFLDLQFSYRLIMINTMKMRVQRILNNTINTMINND